MADSRASDIERELNDLIQGLSHIGISYNKQSLQKFQRYIEILYEYQNRLHLLSHGDYKRIVRGHFLTSLTAFPYIEHCEDACDVGAGAGFPSVPLKIVKPRIGLTLFESKRKKAEFLKYLVSELDICNVEVVNERAEHFKTKKFDLVLLKAVGKIKKLIKTIDNVIAANGVAIFYKSHDIEGELQSADVLLKKRGFSVRVEKLHTSIEQLPLTLVMIKKCKH